MANISLESRNSIIEIGPKKSIKIIEKNIFVAEKKIDSKFLNVEICKSDDELETLFKNTESFFYKCSKTFNYLILNNKFPN